MKHLLPLVLLLVGIGGSGIQDPTMVPSATLLAYNMGWDKGVVIVQYGSQYGTGFWIAENYVATAAHVAPEKGARVKLYKGEWLAEGVVVALLPFEKGDVAIIRVESMPRDAHIFPLLPITEEILAELKGSPVYVLGYPFELIQVEGGDLAKASNNPRVAEGTFAWYDESREIFEFAVITDAGNSGGPVLTEEGAVVGLVSYALPGKAGVMYFASSSNRVIELAESLGIKVRLAAPAAPEASEASLPGEQVGHLSPYIAAGAAGGAVSLLALMAVKGSAGGRKSR